MGTKPNVQVYDNYTQEDFLVWETLVNRQMATLETTVAEAYLSALDVIGFTPKRIPNFIEMNDILAKQTGWHILTVPGLCPPEQFFKHLGSKQFTATCWLRTLSQLDYIEEPDMFHDVFGHAPLLTNPDYCKFFQQLGKLAVKYADNHVVQQQIERLYWFTIEFGLINEDGKMKIYGAGIISSKGETQNALGSHSTKIPFSLHKIINHNFRNDIIQNEYFVIDSFSQLADCLPEFEVAIQDDLTAKTQRTQRKSNSMF